MAYKTGFGFDYQIYWTFIQLVNNISQITVFDWILMTSDHTTLPTEPSVIVGFSLYSFGSDHTAYSLPSNGAMHHNILKLSFIK
jgi:hypothetical protein